jgi:tetratricopeptide (TPR) repeat protein
MGINYGIRKVNNGEERYFEDIMRLYEVALEGDHLLENGLLSRFTYYNIVAAALRTERFDWGEDFIHQYKIKLAKPYRESSFSFCKARLAYAKKEFDEALPLLQKANYKDPLLNLSAKALLLKIYYELDEFDLLQAHLDAMQNYILRKKVIGYHKTNYLNTIRYTKRLLSLNYYDKASIQKLKEKVSAEEILTEKRWILSQLD